MATVRLVRHGLILFGFLIPLISAGFIPASATNYCGPQDHGLWLIQAQANGYGSQGQLSRYNFGLVACTSGDANGKASSHHTYGVRLNADWSGFVEVGISKKVLFGLTTYKVFGEWGFYPDIVGGPYGYGTWSNDGGPVGLKVNNVQYTFDWKIWWDSNGGTTFDLLDTYNGMEAQKGWAWGEASRFGKTGTDIVDHHWDMQFKNSSGNWQDINNLVCGIGTDADNKWFHISDTEFEVDEGGPTLC